LFSGVCVGTDGEEEGAIVTQYRGVVRVGHHCRSGVEEEEKEEEEDQTPLLSTYYYPNRVTTNRRSATPHSSYL